MRRMTSLSATLLLLAAGSPPVLTVALHPGTVPSQSSTRSTPLDPMSDAMQKLEPFLGEWEGVVGGTAPDGTRRETAIRWTSTRAFDGRYIEFQFRSKEPNPQGRHMEWVGLFTFNVEKKEYETIWMNTAIRRAPDRIGEGGVLFFETGTFDETGRVLTLISKQPRGKDKPDATVRSIFELLDSDHFTVTDQELDVATGEYGNPSVFDLRRVK